jgi:rhamnulokinase
MHIAVDLGAGSGRVMLGGLDGDAFSLEEVHRFRYPPREKDGHLRWDFERIVAGILDGLRAAGDRARTLGTPPLSVGVDSWGVDYGLVDDGGRLVEEPACYRDPGRTSLMEEVLDRVPRPEMFARTGIQFLPFNTIYQLYAHVQEGLPAAAKRLLMIPDLVHQRLCGSDRGEYTNASTTQLLDPHTRDWNDGLFDRLGLPRALMPALASPGEGLGVLDADLASRLALPRLAVVAPATHDTGSAVAGTPLRPGWAYISSGTWSLVGVERSAPLLGPAVAAASFTNEGGAFGTIRFLKNVMGLWILESCRKEWADRSDDTGSGETNANLESLLRRAAALDRAPALVYPDDPRFFNPPSMTAEIQAAIREGTAAGAGSGSGPGPAPRPQAVSHVTGGPILDDPASLTRVILDSLALRYASVVETIERLTGETVPGIHVVGGGCLNDYLNQATADATGKPVLAGPVEATAVGNLVLQAIASGFASSLAEARDVVARALPPRLFEPRPTAAWREARDRYRELEARATT